MKTLALALAAGFALSAFAQNVAAQAPRAGHEVAAPAAAAAADARMAQLEAEIGALEAQTERVRGVGDPRERGRLLAEHARALRGTMARMRELDRSFGPQMRAMMGGGSETVSAEGMMLAHGLMARRLAAMQRLMEQIMEQAMGHGAGGPAR